MCCLYYTHNIRIIKILFVVLIRSLPVYVNAEIRSHSSDSDTILKDRWYKRYFVSIVLFWCRWCHREKDYARPKATPPVLLKLYTILSTWSSFLPFGNASNCSTPFSVPGRKYTSPLSKQPSYSMSLVTLSFSACMTSTAMPFACNILHIISPPLLLSIYTLSTLCSWYISHTYETKRCSFFSSHSKPTIVCTYLYMSSCIVRVKPIASVPVLVEKAGSIPIILRVPPGACSACFILDRLIMESLFVKGIPR